MRSIVAQTYVEKEKKILMVQENKEGIKGKWNMPAGKLEDNESIIEAAIREVKEETGIDVKINGILAIQENIAEFGQLIIIYFIGEYISGSISFDNKEISNVKWMTKEEIKKMNKSKIRGSETINKVIALASKKPISMSRLMVENFLNE